MTDQIKFNSTNTIEMNGPTNADTDALSSGGTCTAQLFHDRKDSYLSADEASGQTILSVENPGLYEDDVDIILIQRNDMTWQNLGVITDVGLATGQITVTNSLSNSVSKGAAVRVMLGAAITMTAYGTPVLGTYDWGYRGTILSTHGGLRVGIPVRIEMILNDSGIILTEVITVPVTGGR